MPSRYADARGDGRVDSIQWCAEPEKVTVPTTIYNGTLDISTAALNGVSLGGVSVSHAGSLVTVTYTPTTPPLATGDTVKVSGATCSTGYVSASASRTITVVDATHFTYTSTSGTVWTNTSCTVKATKLAHTAVPPSISKSGTTVTVTLSVAPTPALFTGSLVTVGNGSGTCDAGYQATSATMTKVSTTQFTYTVSTAVTTPGNTSCNITQVNNAPPASPGITLSGTTVTVYLTGHGLATGDLVQVSNGTSGICDSGYQTSSTVTITKVDNNTFTYTPPVGSATTNSNCRIDKIVPGVPVAYTTASTVNANPYYFVIIPTEYCDSMYLTNCIAATAAIGTYTYPAPVPFARMLPPLRSIRAPQVRSSPVRPSIARLNTASEPASIFSLYDTVCSGAGILFRRAQPMVSRVTAEPSRREA